MIRTTFAGPEQLNRKNLGLAGQERVARRRDSGGSAGLQLYWQLFSTGINLDVMFWRTHLLGHDAN